MPVTQQRLWAWAHRCFRSAVSATLGTLPAFDLPWLSETPISGTLAAGEGIAVQVIFDATALNTGVYTGALGIASTDPISPFLSLPVTLNVIQPPLGPVITFDPSSFSATLPITGTQTKISTIRNDGDATLTFTLYEVTTSKRLLSPSLNIMLPKVQSSFPDAPAQVDASVRTQLDLEGKAALILYLRGQPDLLGAYVIPDWVTRGLYVYEKLLETASQSNDVYKWLESRETDPHRLLTANAIATTLDETQLKTVLGFPQVGRVGIQR